MGKHLSTIIPKLPDDLMLILGTNLLVINDGYAVQCLMQKCPNLWQKYHQMCQACQHHTHQLLVTHLHSCNPDCKPIRFSISFFIIWLRGKTMNVYKFPPNHHLKLCILNSPNCSFKIQSHHPILPTISSLTKLDQCLRYPLLLLESIIYII